MTVSPMARRFATPAGFTLVMVGALPPADELRPLLERCLDPLLIGAINIDASL